MLLSRSEFERRIPEFVALSEVCFGRPIPETFWRWRYLDNPDPFLAVNVHVHEDRVVANYSASCMTLAHQSGRRKCLLSMSTMTHPGFAGRGLFTGLAEELYAASHEAGYCGVIGFPNANSHGGFVGRLRWTDITEIPTLAMPGDGIAAHVGARSIEPLDRFPDSFKGPTWLSTPLHVERSREYLEWRFTRHPTNRYQVWLLTAGDGTSPYAVTKRFGSELDIVEFMAPDKSTGASLLSNLVAHSRETRATRINTWIGVHSPLRTAFEKAGFVSQAPVTYFGARSFNGAGRFQHLECDLDHPRNWFIQMSDSDVY